jgi:hypothetical protein
MNSFILNSLNKNTAVPPPSNVISNVNKAPIFGNGATTWVSTTNNAPVNNGYILKISSSQDDVFITTALLFTFYLGGPQTNIYPGSNFYTTFGTGSTVWSGISVSNPNLPKIMFGSGDYSWQRVWNINNTNYYRYRIEGTASASGTPGSPNMVYEVTVVKPNYYGDNNQYIEVLYGNLNLTSGPFLVANRNTNLLTNSLALTTNKSYVFQGNSNGTVWTIYSGSLSTPPY